MQKYFDQLEKGLKAKRKKQVIYIGISLAIVAILAVVLYVVGQQSVEFWNDFLTSIR